MLTLFKRIDLARFLLCDLNYIQIQCKLSGYIALFNFQTTFSFIADRLSTSLHHLANRSVIFNLAQVWDLSNLVFNFFQTFFISTPPFAFQQIAAWSLIYHGLKICQILFQTFLRFFSAPLFVSFATFDSVIFNISQFWYLSNLKLNFFSSFLSTVCRLSLSSPGDRALNYHTTDKLQI